MPGQIAQFIVPSDAIGNPDGAVIDWAHSRFYLYNDFSRTTHGIRSYNLAFATQNPIASVVTGLHATQCCVDGAGDLIVSTYEIDPLCPVYKLDPNSLTVISSCFGTAIFGNYPDYIGVITGSPATANNLACVTVAGVSYGCQKEGTFSTHAGIFRTDTMTPAGFYDVVSTSTVNGTSMMCAGLSSNSLGTFFFVDFGGVSTTSLGLFKVSITAAAKNYNIASWPTPNPAISVVKLRTLDVADINNSWTNITPRGIGYDAATGDIVLCLQSGTGSQNPAQMVVVNPFTGAIVSNTAIDPAPSGWISTNLFQTRMTLGQIAVLGISGTSIWDGFYVPGAEIVSPDSIPGLNIDANFGMFSDDVTQLIVADVSSYTEDTGTPVPVAGTASSFAGWAMLEGLWPPGFPSPPPGGNTVTVGDLWFGETTGFVDLSVVANRRKFVGEDGSTQFIGGTGALPFGTAPPVYLTWGGGGSPDDWADNFGVGGAFGITGGDLTASSAPAPPGGTYGIPDAPDPNTPQGADPQIRLSYSDDGGRTYSLLQKWRSMGKQGEYTKRLRWLKMGQFRQRVIRLEVTDPVRRNIIGVYLDVTEGMD